MNRKEITPQKLSEPISRRDFLRVMGAALTGIAVGLGNQESAVGAASLESSTEKFPRWSDGKFEGGDRRESEQTAKQNLGFDEKSTEAKSSSEFLTREEAAQLPPDRRFRPRFKSKDVRQIPPDIQLFKNKPAPDRRGVVSSQMNLDKMRKIYPDIYNARRPSK